MTVVLDSSVRKCEDVMTRLINKQQSGKEWTIISSHHLLLVL